MTNLPLVSCVILLYNGEKNLPLLLQSLQQQKYKSLEIIFVDNASNDNSVEWLRNNFPQYKIIRLEKNKGFAVGQNIGIRTALGKYIACINQDVYLSSDYFEKIIPLFEKDKTLVSAQGACMQWDGLMNPLTNINKISTIDTLGLKIDSSGKVTNIGEGERGYLPTSTQLVFGVAGTVPVYRRDILDECAYRDAGLPEYFNEAFFFLKEDVELAWRLNLFGGKSIIVPEALAFHVRTAKKRSPWNAIRSKGLQPIFVANSLQNQQRTFLVCMRCLDFNPVYFLCRQFGYLLMALYQRILCKTIVILWRERTILRRRRSFVQQSSKRSIRRWLSSTFVPYV